MVNVEWVLERLFAGAVLIVSLWLMSTCWQALRTNQRLALADAFESKREERRSLLLQPYGIRAV